MKVTRNWVGSAAVLTALLGLAACGQKSGSTLKAADLSSTGHIVGGVEVKSGEPIAAMTAMLYDTKQSALCTASILSDEWLVTAGHCVEGSEAQDLVVIFATDIDALKNAGDAGSAQQMSTVSSLTRRVATFQQNPGYNQTMAKLEAMDEAAKAKCAATGRGNGNNGLVAAPAGSSGAVAMLAAYKKRHGGGSDDGNGNKPSTPSNPTTPPPSTPDQGQTDPDASCGLTSADIDNVKDWGDLTLIHITGKIPTGYQAADLLPVGVQLTKGESIVLAGYGNTSGGQMGTGAGVLRQTNVNISEPVWGTTEVLFDQTTGHGGCHGDSGGPAYVSQNGKYLLFGVTSRGVHDETDSCGTYAAYTNLQSYRDWIKQVSGL